MTLKERLLKLLALKPGLTDREATDELNGKDALQQPVHQAASQLAKAGLVVRQRRASDGRIGNYLSQSVPAAVAQLEPAEPPGDFISEDQVKETLRGWLEADGWEVEVKLGHQRGIDVDARRGGSRRIIEAKGQGKMDQMRVIFFLTGLGVLLRRMDDPSAQYSIALPDRAQYRRLWHRLPALAKERNHLTALFVTASGTVEEVG